VIAQIDAANRMVDKVNGSGFVDDATLTSLKAVLGYEFMGEPFFTEGEKEALSIRKGTLTDGERKIMENHVVTTGKILDKVHFNKAFENTPVWAARHHECLNGEGYPAGLKGDELGLDERILAVSDICDALLATDRPYKKPIPLDKAFEIMRDMASEGRIDGKVVGYLYDCLREQ
jgi:HD-GYP domain-containing protein (c-di-GMP phosphodiesterase class II)